MPIGEGALGGWLAAAGALAAAFAVRRVFLGYPRIPGLRRLAPREAALVAAAAEALYPAGGAVAPSGAEAGVLAYTDRYLAAVPPATRQLMRLLFFAFEQAPLLLPAPGRGGRRRFSALPVAQREALLEAWRRSRLFPLRLAFTSLRAIVTMAYFAHPPVQRALGLAPFDVTTPAADVDALYPPIGAREPATGLRRGPRLPDRPAERPLEGDPLRLDSPLRPDPVEVPR